MELAEERPPSWPSVVAWHATQRASEEGAPHMGWVNAARGERVLARGPTPWTVCLELQPEVAPSQTFCLELQLEVAPSQTFCLELQPEVAHRLTGRLTRRPRLPYPDPCPTAHMPHPHRHRRRPPS